MKKTFFAMMLVVAMTLLASAVYAVDGPVYMESQRVLDNFGKPNANPLIGKNTDAYNVQTNRRTANGNIEIHVKETDIFYILDGSATLVFGGTPVEPSERRPNQLTAKDIKDGEVHEVKKGDVIVIPAGTPHWFKDVHGSINYLTVKSIQP